jgi:hypothetical protein
MRMARTTKERYIDGWGIDRRLWVLGGNDTDGLGNVEAFAVARVVAGSYHLLIISLASSPRTSFLVFHARSSEMDLSRHMSLLYFHSFLSTYSLWNFGPISTFIYGREKSVPPMGGSCVKEFTCVCEDVALEVTCALRFFGGGFRGSKSRAF